MIRVNFIIENFKALKYLGCSTAAMQIAEVMKKDVEIKINSNERGFDIVHAHTFGPVAIYHTIKDKNAIKIVSAHSTPSINKNNIISGGWKIWNLIYSKIYNRFDYVLAVSNFSVEELKRIGIKKKMFVIENGVNRNKFKYDSKRAKKFREQNDLEKNDFVVLNVAQVTPRKGVYDFIKVAKLMPDAKFIWIGGFPYKFASADYFNLKKITKMNARLRNLKFLGFVPDIVGAYSASDVLFTPSFAETFGLTVIEAGACRLPVVARDLRVFRELFGDNIKYGSNCKEFAEVLKKFKNKDFRNRQSKKMYKISEKYDMKVIANKLFNLYKRLVKNEI